ncbi:MAG: succinylglutamate desuccinylase/aspartoacylase family protein [Saprospiraceae bacterium]|nr:succinylglutamate desuccinylase/aspartoacylase family protein [Saprospiraceae bacterium]MBK8855896.1 succinylglutamate desuccinylase/aspartoacylase family protein [Saprospiraceae bacterium]MBK9043254.1 succinylglutamate desuccinylase/aspartoacylase family protein [Saprospiraceae bacterium]
MERVVCSFEGGKGPLFVVSAAMHGNETSGIAALKETCEILNHEKKTNPDLKFRGTFAGILGNIQAINKNVRYIENDLNRMWESDFVYDILKEDVNKQMNEVKEMHEIIITLRNYVITGKYNKLYLLDLHTTSSDGIFVICTEDKESKQIAGHLHAPLVRGLLKGISGTTLHYFNKNNLGIEATALAFEGGHHEDPLSVKRMVAAIFNCMRSIGCIDDMDVHNSNDTLLMSYSKNLPKSVEVIYKYHVQDKTSWEMKPGFTNFDPVKKGQLLANDISGPVYCPLDGLILMPLYQKKGRDGFFIVKPL